MEFLRKNREIFVFLLLYVVLLNTITPERAFEWDEGGQTSVQALAIYDLAEYIVKENPNRLSEIKNFVLSYHNHYRIIETSLKHPPLLGIFYALSFSFFGIHEIPIIFMTSFFSALGVVFTYFLSLEFWDNKNQALFSAIFLALSPRYFQLSKMVMYDVPLTAIISLSFLLYIKMKKSDFKEYFWPFVLSLGAALLIKKSAIGFFGLMGFDILIKKKNQKDIFRGILTAGLIALPWYIFYFGIPGFLGTDNSILGFHLHLLRPGIRRSLAGDLYRILETEFTSASIIFIILGLLLGFKEKKYELITLAITYYVMSFIILWVDVTSTSRYVLVGAPALALLTGRVFYKNRKKSWKIIQIIFFTIFILLSSAQISRAAVYHRLDQTAEYLQQNMETGGVLTSYMSLQFYLMKYDRNRNLYLYYTLAGNDVEDLLNKKFPAERKGDLRLKIPEFKYLVVYKNYPDDITLFTPPNLSENLIKFAENAENIEFEKKIEGRGRQDILIYRIKNND